MECISNLSEETLPMSNFVMERSPKRESINKGNAFAYQYDQLERNPLGDSQVHKKIKAEIIRQGMDKSRRTNHGLSFLRKEISPFEENLKERDRYVICGTYRRDVDKTVARGQASLVLAGYDLGEYGYKGVDGVNGRLTQKALKEFQTAIGLKPTGEFDRDTMKALDLVAATGLTKAEIEAIGRKVMQGREMEKPVLPKSRRLNHCHLGN